MSVQHVATVAAAVKVIAEAIERALDRLNGALAGFGVHVVDIELDANNKVNITVDDTP